jgi:hypothetical protein
VSVDPETGAMHVFHRGGFVAYEPGDDTLPEVERSVDWHGNRRDFVPPALVRAAMASKPAVMPDRVVHHA